MAARSSAVEREKKGETLAQPGQGRAAERCPWPRGMEQQQSEQDLAGQSTPGSTQQDLPAPLQIGQGTAGHTDTGQGTGASSSASSASGCGSCPSSCCRHTGLVGGSGQG